MQDQSLNIFIRIFLFIRNFVKKKLSKNNKTNYKYQNLCFTEISKTKYLEDLKLINQIEKK